MPIPLSAGQRSEHLLVAGPAGNIETVVDHPAGEPVALALVAHPHPLFGGTLDNKVAQTLARTMVELGAISVRTNFRGVGATEGEHADGEGETDDLVHVVAWARERYGAALPLHLCGFSFGAYVQSRVAERVQPTRVVLVGMASGVVRAGRSYTAPDVPKDTIVIHGETDETVPLANVLDWARPQELPVVVAPGCDHFFHRKLHLIRNIVRSQWRPS